MEVMSYLHSLIELCHLAEKSIVPSGKKAGSCRKIATRCQGFWMKSKAMLGCVRLR